jgi:cold-inducible RNA-binding protein
LFVPVRLEKVVIMEVKIFVGNLSASTTEKQLTAIFARAGDVLAVHIITDRLTGGSKGYAYITMSAQSEADKAVSMLNRSLFEEHRLKVILLKSREQRGSLKTH